MTDLRVKPSAEVEQAVAEDQKVEAKTTEQLKDELLQENEEEEIPDVETEVKVDIFDRKHKTLTKIEKQQRKMEEQKRKLDLKEKRQRLRQEKEELKKQKLRIRERELEFKNSRQKKTPAKKEPAKKKPAVKKKQMKKVVEEVEEYDTDSSEEYVYIRKKKKKTKPKKVKLNEEQLTELYKVFKSAEEKVKPKPAPKPQVNMFNPIPMNEFSHLSNPFNF